MSTTVTYKGATIATADNQTKTLLTAGKYMEDNITITDTGGGGGGGQSTVTYTVSDAIGLTPYIPQSATYTYDALNMSGVLDIQPSSMIVFTNIAPITVTISDGSVTSIVGGSRNPLYIYIVYIGNAGGTITIV